MAIPKKTPRRAATKPRDPTGSKETKRQQVIAARLQAVTSDTYAQADASECEAAPIMPLDVMLGAMREFWARAEELKEKPDSAEERLGLIRQASAEAHKVAVFVHPRLSSLAADKDSDAVDAKPQNATTAVAGLLGSRELARRLLFAVAFYEHIEPKTAAPANRSDNEVPSNREKS